MAKGDDKVTIQDMTPLFNTPNRFNAYRMPGPMQNNTNQAVSRAQSRIPNQQGSNQQQGGFTPPQTPGQIYPTYDAAQNANGGNQPPQMNPQQNQNPYIQNPFVSQQSAMGLPPVPSMNDYRNALRQFNPTYMPGAIQNFAPNQPGFGFDLSSGVGFGLGSNVGNSYMPALLPNPDNVTKYPGFVPPEENAPRMPQGNDGGNTMSGFNNSILNQYMQGEQMKTQAATPRNPYMPR